MTEILDRWGLIAEYLRVSERTVLRYAEKGILQITRDPAGHPIITKTELDKWKLQHTTE
jgi:excisionase family DNA binding protein